MTKRKRFDALTRVVGDQFLDHRPLRSLLEQKAGPHIKVPAQEFAGRRHSVLAMEARSGGSLPRGVEWQYEPKWDGFRCLLVRSGERVRMQSKSGRALARYCPAVVVA